MHLLLLIALIINSIIIFLILCVSALVAWDFYKFNKNDEERMRLDAATRKVCCICEAEINEDLE